MARRRVSLWVDEEVYDDYRVLAGALHQTVSDVMRESLRAGLPEPEELVRDFGLSGDLLRSNGAARAGGRVVVWRRLAALVRRR